MTIATATNILGALFPGNHLQVGRNCIRDGSLKLRDTFFWLYLGNRRCLWARRRVVAHVLRIYCSASNFEDEAHNPGENSANQDGYLVSAIIFLLH